MTSVKTFRIIVTGIIGGAIILAALWLLLPTFQPDEETALLSSTLGAPLTLMDAVIAMGGAILFLRAIHNFRQALRPAYQLIAYAQLCVGVGALLFPYIEYYSLWDNVWLNMATYLGYLFGSVLAYLGARKFYQSLELPRSKLTSLFIVGGSVVAIWLLHAFMPHADSWGVVGFSELQYDLFEFVPTVPVIMYAVALYLTLHMKRQVGGEYQAAFGWLTVGLGLVWFSAAGVAVMEVIGFENWYFISRAYALPSILGDLALLLAAYHFNIVGLPSEGSILRAIFKGRQRNVSSLEIVMYTARLVAKPEKIDEQIDRVRSITARAVPGEALQLSAEDQQVLREVYLALEAYLTSGQDLKTYTREDVRKAVARHLRLRDETVGNTFWGSLTT